MQSKGLRGEMVVGSLFPHTADDCAGGSERLFNAMARESGVALHVDARLAIDGDVAVQQLEYAALRGRLEEDGQVLRLRGEFAVPRQ